MYKMFPLRERAMYRKLSKKSFKKSRLIRGENIVWWKLFLCESNRYIEKPNLIIKQPRFNIICNLQTYILKTNFFNFQEFYPQKYSSNPHSKTRTNIILLIYITMLFDFHDV